MLSVVSGGKLVLSRYIMNGSALYDNMAAEKSGAAREDIERARLSGDFSKIAMDPYDSESVMSMCFSDIVEQITQTANHYMSGISGEKLSYVAVVGEGGLIPGIVEYFAQSHSLAARELRPSDEASAACRALMKNENPNMLLAAVGAALAGAGIRDRGRDMEMNFAPALSSGAGGRQGFVFGRLTAAVAAAILIAAVSVAAGLYFIADQRRNTAEAVSIDAQISSDTQAAEHGEAVSIARRKLSALSAVADAIDARSVRASELLDELTTQAPESLFVINFSMADANSAALSGRARDYGSVSEFASTLRQTGLYDSVRINSISANESVSDARNDYSFTMTITFVTK
ncbi:MAG: PilN domain-containing protein [Oscillospiraceae bacterium]|nr:PilN domain-containing protein [Oscillospiraceae bacterium]